MEEQKSGRGGERTSFARGAHCVASIVGLLVIEQSLDWPLVRANWPIFRYVIAVTLAVAAVSTAMVARETLQAVIRHWRC